VAPSVETIAEWEDRFVIPRHGRMRVPGAVFASRALIPGSGSGSRPGAGGQRRRTDRHLAATRLVVTAQDHRPAGSGAHRTPQGGCLRRRAHDLGISRTGEENCAATWGTGIYIAACTERVYSELLDRARGLLALGESVIADASFISPAQRDAAAAAAAAGPACQIEAPGRLLRVRSLLHRAYEQINRAGLPPEGMPRLQRQLQAIRRELEDTVSPAAGCGAGTDPAIPGRGAQRGRVADRVHGAPELGRQLDDADAQHSRGATRAPGTAANGSLIATASATRNLATRITCIAEPCVRKEPMPPMP